MTASSEPLRDRPAGVCPLCFPSSCHPPADGRRCAGAYPGCCLCQPAPGAPSPGCAENIPFWNRLPLCGSPLPPAAASPPPSESAARHCRIRLLRRIFGGGAGYFFPGTVQLLYSPTTAAVRRCIQNTGFSSRWRKRAEALSAPVYVSKLNSIIDKSCLPARFCGEYRLYKSPIKSRCRTRKRVRLDSLPI